MSIPIEPATVGISAVSGGAVILFLMKIAPILLRKMNGNSKGNNSSKPGQTKICIDNVKKIVEHDTTIKHLCAVNVEIKESMAETREENREAHTKLFDKLDALK